WHLTVPRRPRLPRNSRRRRKHSNLLLPLSSHSRPRRLWQEGASPARFAFFSPLSLSLSLSVLSLPISLPFAFSLAPVCLLSLFCHCVIGSCYSSFNGPHSHTPPAAASSAATADP